MSPSIHAEPQHQNNKVVRVGWLTFQRRVDFLLLGRLLTQSWGIIIDEDLLKAANFVKVRIRIHPTNWTSFGPLKGKIEGGEGTILM